MTDAIDYPPTRTLVLEQALADAEARLEAATAEGDSVRPAREAVDALRWAIDQWGEEAAITLAAFSTATRSEVLDTANRVTMGPVGESQLADWLLAGAIEDAPWLDGGEDLQTRHDCVGALPPALTDYLDRELRDLNDLGN